MPAKTSTGIGTKRMIWIASSEKDTGTAALEKRLWDAADQFRANSGLKSQEYSAPVLGLIFLRFAAQRAKLEKASASTTGKYVKSYGVYCLGRGVCGLSSKYQCFIDLLFENESPTLLGQTSGSTFPSWTGPQLKNHPVLSSPPNLLARFEALAKPMSSAELGYSRKIQNLRRTRDLLLPRLLSGQVELNTN